MFRETVEALDLDGVDARRESICLESGEGVGVMQLRKLDRDHGRTCVGHEACGVIGRTQEAWGLK